jgi:hypothetical protein
MPTDAMPAQSIPLPDSSQASPPSLKLHATPHPQR